MIITLSGEPKSTQHIYGLQCRGAYPSRYMTTEGKQIKQGYQLEAKCQWRKKPLEGDVELWVTLYFGTKRKADLDNFNKILLDSLTDIVYLDDSQIHALHIQRDFDKANPRIEIDVVA